MLCESGGMVADKVEDSGNLKSANLSERYNLALSDDEAKKIGPTQFEQAGWALLAVSPKTETALELMKHRLQVVRGRAILDCLTNAKKSWAKSALEKAAPHAWKYLPPE